MNRSLMTRSCGALARLQCLIFGPADTLLSWAVWLTMLLVSTSACHLVDLVAAHSTSPPPPSGRPCRKWLDQLRDSSNCPTGDFWRRAVCRRHCHAVTQQLHGGWWCQEGYLLRMRWWSLNPNVVEFRHFFQIRNAVHFQTHSDSNSDSAFVLESTCSSFVAIRC